MSIDNFEYPQDYENKQKGRVVSGILNLDDGTGFLYENRYKDIRNAFEDLRQQYVGLFRAGTNYILDQGSLSHSEVKKIEDILKTHDVSLQNDLTERVVRDWAKNSPSLSSSYKPQFMLNADGQPITKEFYDKVAQKIDQIRDKNPEFSKNLDQLLKNDPSGVSLIHSESWYKNSIENNISLARQFSQAVSSLSGLEINAARSYVQSNPAPSENTL